MPAREFHSRAQIRATSCLQPATLPLQVCTHILLTHAVLQSILSGAGSSPSGSHR